MTCKAIFDIASMKRKDLDAPVRIYPICHPKCSVDVFVDSKHSKIILCCSVCDRVMDTVRTKWMANGGTMRTRKGKKV